MPAEARQDSPDLTGENWRDAYDIICDYYRLALFNSLYCGKRLRRVTVLNTAFEIAIAILASIVAGLTTFKGDLNPNPLIVASLAIAAAVLSAAKPVLRLSEAVARYSGQHSGHREVYLAYKDLVGFVRVERRVSPIAWREHETLSKRYRALDAAGDANPSVKVREALKQEVELLIPIEHLRIS